MSSISDKIRAIEKELDLEGFRFRDENVWPVIRIAIYLSSTKSTSSNAPRLKSMLFLWSGMLHFFSGLLVNAIRRRKYQSVLVTTSHYKVTENGKTFDKIIEPVIQYLDAKGVGFSVWEFTGKFKYDRKISYRSMLRPIQTEIYFLSFLRKLLRPFRKKAVLTGEVAKLNSLLLQHAIPFRIGNSFIDKLEVIFFQANFFQKALKAHEVRRVFMVCYYDVKCFSILLAANRLGIPSIDLQHGVQGKSHLAYAHWPHQVVSSTRFLPTHFYVWDENSHDTIRQWKDDAQRILLGCNKWMMDRVKHVSNDVILLTLQPIDNYFPEYVLDMIRQYTGDKKWYIRLHPRQLAEMDTVERRLNEAGVSQKVDVRNASLLPLTTLLERTVLHVTFYSSVVIEAGYYDIPTYFLGEEQLSYYAGYLRNDLVYYYPKHDVSTVIHTIMNERTKEIHRKDDRINVLDNFIHDKR